MRIDAHHHLWRLERGDYGWLTPDLAALYRDFAPSDFAPQLAAQGVGATVLVQAAPTAAETDHLLELAAATDWIAGVVGWTDLAADDAPTTIASLARRPKLVGVRPMLQDLADRAWILRPDVQPALAAMAAADLALDALVHGDQLPAIIDIAQRHRGLSIVLDHAGKPAVGGGPTAAWRGAMHALAVQPNVTVKLSGLLTEAPPGADAAMIAPFFDTLLAAFGPDRILWGSDWPVLTLAADYARWCAITDTLLAPIGEAARDAILGGNAARIYRLELT